MTTSGLQPYLDAIEVQLQHIVTDPAPALAPFYNMLAYHLGWLDPQFRPVNAYSGKRVRPLLCLLTCEAAGGDWHRALPAAAALELAHNFSLIHDDIEDNSLTRRGRPTLWQLWGLSQGVNAGDGMLVLACRALVSPVDEPLTSALQLSCIEVLHQTILSLCHGQYLDIAAEGHLDVCEEAYLQMIGGKTAALLAASTHLGALVAGAGDKIVHYRQFGWNLGLAFQMVDDILGIWGDPAITGKPAAGDIRSHKMTLPVIVALRDPDIGAQLIALYRQPQWNDADVVRAVSLIEHSGARAYVQSLVESYAEAATAALHASGAQPGIAERLGDLADSLTTRQH